MFLPVTHVDSGGVEWAFVGDAGVAAGVGELAVGQQAPPVVYYGLHHGHQEAEGGGSGQEACDEACDQQEPFLQGDDGHNECPREQPPRQSTQMQTR